MDQHLRSQAEARLGAAAAELGLADPRPAYRERLRLLRETDAGAFDQAIRHYETAVIDALARQDPILAWIEYGNFLAGLSGRARLSVIDRTGLATPFQPPLPHGSLAIFIPDDTAVPALVAAMPAEPSRPQQSALILLTTAAP